MAYEPVRRLLSRFGLELLRVTDRRDTARGLGWTAIGDTMVGIDRLEQIERCVGDVIAREVPGDLMETGVWRGGASIFMRALLEVHGDGERRMWLADSFAGLPRPDADTYPSDSGDRHWERRVLAVGMEEVKAAFARYGMLDDRVCFLPGWFRDTLPGAPVDRLAVLRLDGDMYESTMVALEALYDCVSPGGYVIIDDYALEGCREAVEDFRRRQDPRDAGARRLDRRTLAEGRVRSTGAPALMR